MRKLSTILLAVALVLGLAQCKKEQTTTPQSEGVMITLKVGDNNNGSRANVNPTGADQVTFEDGDQILVAYDGHYVGTLEKSTVGSVSQFSGTINITQNGEKPLYFYFLGNKIDVSTLTTGETTECTVNISNQTEELPVISMGKSIDAEGRTVYYEEGTTSYSSRLYCKCSLMKFNVTKSVAASSQSAICVKGFNNLVTVDFGDPTDSGFTYSMDGEGQIMMKGGAGASIETWAIVLKQESGLSAGEAYINGYKGTRAAINNAFGPNEFLDGGVNINITTQTGMLIGEFSVSDSKKLHFSQGNLQAIGTTASSPTSGWTWSFAANQYDYIGGQYSGQGEPTGNNYITGSGTMSANGTVDLFGWSTDATYYGIHNSFDSNDYNGDFKDWGENTISNGGNQTNLWRTLTAGEWTYLFSNHTYGMHQVHGVNGIIVLPDGVVSATGFTSGMENWEPVSNDDWTDMEAAGAVFLPTAGARVMTIVNSMNNTGCYWSSTSHESDQVYILFFRAGDLSQGNNRRASGCSVRLVRDISAN